MRFQRTIGGCQWKALRARKPALEAKPHTIDALAAALEKATKPTKAKR